MKIKTMKTPHAQVIETEDGDVYLWLMAPNSTGNGVFLKREQIGERDGFLVVDNKEENVELAKAGIDFVLNEIKEGRNQP